MPADGISAADGRVATSTRRCFLAALGQMAVHQANSLRSLVLPCRRFTLGRLSKTAHFRQEKRDTHFGFAIALVPARGGRLMLTRSDVADNSRSAMASPAPSAVFSPCSCARRPRVVRVRHPYAAILAPVGSKLTKASAGRYNSRKAYRLSATWASGRRFSALPPWLKCAVGVSNHPARHLSNRRQTERRTLRSRCRSRHRKCHESVRRPVVATSVSGTMTGTSIRPLGVPMREAGKSRLAREVADAVGFEPVSTPKFPFIRENNREFCESDALSTVCRPQKSEAPSDIRDSKNVWCRIHRPPLAPPPAVSADT